MKTNKMMRIASVLLVAVLLTTCSISGTFAKYVSEATGTDTARVAYWGWGGDSALIIDGLFAEMYALNPSATIQGSDDNSVASYGGNVIAPGTAGSAPFSFKYTTNTTELNPTVITAPEVDYTFDVTVVGNCDADIQANKNIQWKLDNGEWGTWTDLLADIGELGEGDDNGVYEAGQLPKGFGTNDTHTISWQWIFEDPAVDTDDENTYTVGGKTLTQDEYDTYMGNKADLDDVSITITITATQID